MQNQAVVSYVPTYPMMQDAYISQTYVKTVFISPQYQQYPQVTPMAQNYLNQAQVFPNQENDSTNTQYQATEYSKENAKL